MLLRRQWHASPANQLRSELDQFFANFLGNPGGNGLDVFPPVNVWEEQDTLYVEAELPGSNENLDLTVVENELILKGQRRNRPMRRPRGRLTIGASGPSDRLLGSSGFPSTWMQMASRRHSKTECCW